MGYMRWKKKGYEMDEIAEKLVTRFSQIPRIYIFGAGIKGGELAPILHKYGCLEAYIDNDISKQQQGYKNRKVYSYYGKTVRIFQFKERRRLFFT